MAPGLLPVAAEGPSLDHLDMLFQNLDRARMELNGIVARLNVWRVETNIQAWSIQVVVSV